jgi:hypothetical protein
MLEKSFGEQLWRNSVEKHHGDIYEAWTIFRKREKS